KRSFSCLDPFYSLFFSDTMIRFYIIIYKEIYYILKQGISSTKHITLYISDCIQELKIKFVQTLIVYTYLIIYVSNPCFIDIKSDKLVIYYIPNFSCGTCLFHSSNIFFFFARG